MYRRKALVAFGAGTVGALAGCLDSLAEELTRRSATPATVADRALEETGYEYRETTEAVERAEVADQTVEATSYAVEYSRSLEGFEVSRVGVFATIATPRVTLGGHEVNPIGNRTNEELATFIQDTYSELTVGEVVDSREVVALGKAVSISTHEGTATAEGHEDVDVYLDIAAPDNGDDHLLFLGVYPAVVQGEAENVDALAEGVEHDG